MAGNKLTAIIPAAGLGTRMRPLTYSRPKALLPLAGRRMIDYVLETVINAGASRIILIVGHLAGQVAAYVKENYNQEIICVEQKEFLGLGHAVVQAAGLVKGESLIFLGDTLIEGDISKYVASGYSWLAVKEVEDPRSFGVVITDEEGWIQKMVEKPEKVVSRKAIVGVYHLQNSLLLFQCLSSLIQNNIRTRGEYQLTDALQLMIKAGEKIKAVGISAWYDCGRVETLLQTNQVFLNKYRGNCWQIPDVVINPPVYLAAGVKVERSSIGPYVCLGQGVVVKNSQLKNVIVDENSLLENVSLVDSVIGQRARVLHYSGRLKLGDDAEVSGDQEKFQVSSINAR